MQQLAALQGSGGPDVEAIFVDGGSTDGTLAEITAQAGRFDGKVIVLEKEAGPGGYGIDIQRGLAKARGAVVAWTHADLQCELADVLRAHDMLRAAGGNSVIVKGVRRGRPILDRSFTFGMEMLNFLVTRHVIHDINGQPKVFRREFLADVLKPDAPPDFSFDLFVLNTAAAKGYKILGIPVEMKSRLHGEAKGGGSTLRSKIRLARRTARYMLSLARRT